MRQAVPLAGCGVILVAATTWAVDQSNTTAPSGRGQVETAQVKQLKQQVQTFRRAASMTDVNGPGVVLELQDKPGVQKEAAKKANAKEEPEFMAGVVHDFDLLQVINELRAQKAEAIAVNGIRLSNYTSIRCVGTDIHIGGQVTKHPYKVQAIGNRETLLRTLTQKGGTLESLRSTGLVVKVSKAVTLRLPSATDTPSFQFAK